jgi:hypothetical protein
MMIAPIVEGHGEVEAVPKLIRRIAAHLAPEVVVDVGRPHRVKRQLLVKEGELERVVSFAADRVGAGGAILVLLDADDDCPADVGPALLARARGARPDREVSVVLANRMFEAWFVAGIESLRGRRTIDPGAHRPPDPEAVANPKHWLDDRMIHRYSPTVDQPALSAILDLKMAATAPSFDKFVRDIARLIGAQPSLPS